MEVAPFTCVFSECSRNLFNEVSVSSQLTSMCVKEFGLFHVWFFLFIMNSSHSENYSKIRGTLKLLQEYLAVIGNSKI